VVPETQPRSESEIGAYFLKTERAGFRPWTPDDLPLALTLWGDPEVTKFIDARGRLSEPQVHERLLKEIATQEAWGVQYWPVFLLSTNDFIGCCGLRPYRPSERLFELGVHLRATYWGEGYATEVALALMAYAFGQLGLGALFAGHNPNNQASRSLLRKLGFRHTHDEYYAPTGLQHPSYLFTREEFVHRYPTRLSLRRETRDL
jgi:RimJ/RimL family protein N-acetyltransferase